MIGSIVVVSVLTCCALLHYIYDLKAEQMNIHYSQMFCNISVCVYLKTKVEGIVVVSVLTCCALLHYIYDLKAEQMNIHYSQMFCNISVCVYLKTKVEGTSYDW